MRYIPKGEQPQCLRRFLKTQVEAKLTPLYDDFRDKACLKGTLQN